MGSVLHAGGEEGVACRHIAEAIGRRLQLPTTSVSNEQATEHFGFLGPFVALDIPASSAHTRELLGWEPTGPGLLDDIDAGAYDAALLA